MCLVGQIFHPLSVNVYGSWGTPRNSGHVLLWPHSWSGGPAAWGSLPGAWDHSPGQTHWCLGLMGVHVDSVLKVKPRGTALGTGRESRDCASGPRPAWVSLSVSQKPCQSASSPTPTAWSSPVSAHTDGWGLCGLPAGWLSPPTRQEVSGRGCVPCWGALYRFVLWTTGHQAPSVFSTAPHAWI